VQPILDSNEQLINRMQEILQQDRINNINILNDKLTLSVFSQLQEQMKKVSNINLILKDPIYNGGKELSIEFKLNKSTDNILFNKYDIIQKNKLTHLNNAKDMYEFIEKYVKVKKLKNNCIKNNLFVVDDKYAMFGDSSLEISDNKSLSLLRTFSLNAEFTDIQSIDKLQRNFEMLWNNSEYTQDFKKELLEKLQFIYKDYSPEFIYFFTLYSMFGGNLEENYDKFENDKIGFKDTKIWNSLYKFQKDAVVSAINKIEKYNGCIIADSVGLGKTFEALGIIKYYELRQHKVLVLTPKKLHANWASYRNNYKDNPFECDRFAYDIVNHSDLSRKYGNTDEGLDLERINWGNYDLLVIDESHNFRNRQATKDRTTRYDKLIRDIVLRGVKTKVLLLTATPVNNSLTDLKNQISIITLDKDNAFYNDGIESVSQLLRKSQIVLNKWIKSTKKNKEELLDELPKDFFELLEMITISRSRKHITSYYGESEVGKFPEKLKPKTIYSKIDMQDKLLEFNDLNNIVEELKLSVYSPMSYIKSEYKQYYRELHKQSVRDGKSNFYQEDREINSLKLHKFNIYKRMESSVYSFSETLKRMLNKIDNFIYKLENAQKNGVIDGEVIDEDIEAEGVLDYKYEIKLEHIDKKSYLLDLYGDKKILEKIIKQTDEVLQQKRDLKLHNLKVFLENKITLKPYNNENKKVIIFTAFSDTAKYLYNAIAEQFKDIYDVNTAIITGGDKPKTTNKNIRNEFNTVLSRFSPKSKLKEGLDNKEQIDILIATDCISEGQNLQDCDCVINYDIQWNPVVLIQRFGRIDRIGSTNKKIAMINFFPDMELNEYLNLERRVKGKMVATNITSTGDEDLLTPEMNDFSFRKSQLEKLKDEVIDIDDTNDSISISDLNMNDYVYDLIQYLRENPELKKVPNGIYSITYGESKGCIFCFRDIKQVYKSDKDKFSSYFLIYVSEDGEILYSNKRSRSIMKLFRSLCYGKKETYEELLQHFKETTDNAKDMSKYSSLVTKAIRDITGKVEEENMMNIFEFDGFNEEFSDVNEEDYELISFLIVE
jgi:superfamily II DNA/RNA helicase